MCEYLTQSDREPDPVTPYQIVRAVKGLPFDGCASIIVGGLPRRFDSGSPQPAISWAAERLEGHVFAEHRDEPIAIVPIPGHAHVSAEGSGGVHRLGRAVAEALRRRGMPITCRMNTDAFACALWFGSLLVAVNPAVNPLPAHLDEFVTTYFAPGAAGRAGVVAATTRSHQHSSSPGIRAVAAKRSTLPPGGAMPDDTSAVQHRTREDADD